MQPDCPARVDQLTPADICRQDFMECLFGIHGKCSNYKMKKKNT